MAYIEFNDIVKTYQMGEVSIQAIDHAQFDIEQGELVCILGPSGAGKTTALNILGGMDSASSGQVLVDGIDITQLKNKALVNYRRNDIGFVFQFYNLIQNLTALEKVGLAERQKNFPAQLSGGEQQRVAIARALAKNPKLLLCDEPTGALDYETGKQVLKLLQDTCLNTGTTVIVITHNSAIAPMANRVIEIN